MVCRERGLLLRLFTVELKTTLVQKMRAKDSPFGWGKARLHGAELGCRAVA